MKIVTLQVGPIGTNCYILCDEEAAVCAVIDPGDEPRRIAAAIAGTGCTPEMILLTHGHFDHYTGVGGLLELYPALPVYIHRADTADKPGGDYREILASLKRLAQLPGDYTCYPGHMEPTTLSFERQRNPYMKQGMTL